MKRSFKTIRVREVMTTTLVTVSPEDSLQHALDLLVGIPALLEEIAVMAHRAARAVLVLGADAREIDELGIADAGHRHRLGEDALGPFGMVEFIDPDLAVLRVTWCDKARECEQQGEEAECHHLFHGMSVK